MAHHALRRASLVFFFVCVASLIVAGAWGLVGQELVGVVLIFLATRTGLAGA